MEGTLYKQINENESEVSKVILEKADITEDTEEVVNLKEFMQFKTRAIDDIVGLNDISPVFTISSNGEELLVSINSRLYVNTQAWQQDMLERQKVEIEDRMTTFINDNIWYKKYKGGKKDE